KSDLVGGARGMAQARLVLVVAAAVAVAGCASVQQNVRGWLGETPAEQQGTPYFSALDGLPVHAQASGAAQIVGRLTLHERVVRPRLEAGWAYVTAEDGGLSGWVDNAQLIWRLPATEHEAPAASPDQAPSTSATGAGPAPSVSPAPPAATPTPPAATPTP